ncbi:MAG: hypothetical protein V3574_02115 [Candidatus Moraniibacteriota bacterium]
MINRKISILLSIVTILVITLLFYVFLLKDSLKENSKENITKKEIVSPKISAEEKYPIKDIPEFRTTGNWIVCTQPSSYKEQENEDFYGGCLRIGKLKMNMSVEEVDGMYGKPYEILNTNESEEIRIYLLTETISSSSENKPYLAVSFRNKKSNSIQISGQKITEDLSFSSIYLGDSKDKVREILGNPFSEKAVEENGANLWEFGPFHFSIEIKEGVVYSIRIWNKQ